MSGSTSKTGLSPTNAIATLAPSELYQNAFQSFSVFRTADATIKYIKRWRIARYPSMRSKLLQKLLKVLVPNRSARPTTATNRVIAASIHEKRGRYRESRKASKSHAAKMISTIMRNVKFLPVMYGKNIDAETMNGIMTGTAIRPPIVIHRSVSLNMRSTIPCSTSPSYP